jgi:uncharacterized protein (TIGR00730 family)
MRQSKSTARTVCVFCGAGGKMPLIYMQAAFKLGQELASNGFALLTGGANVGMMKEVVDGHAAVISSATRHGVIPKVFAEFNISHPLISVENLIWVDNLHDRLQSFCELADDIVVLPGGFGTLHELMDCLVHSQFGLITKRIFLLNINNFWEGIIAQFQYMVKQKAVQQKHVDHLIVVNSIAELLQLLKSEEKIELFQGIETQRWESES